MDGLIMDRQLLVSSLLWRAERLYAQRTGTAVTADGSRRHFTYAEMAQDARRLAGALSDLGIQPGERISALAWNTYEYLTAYFGVPGLGAVLHTVNHRMSTAHIVHTIRTAGSKVLIVDHDLLPVLEVVEPELDGIEHLIVVGGGNPRTSIPSVHYWEGFLADATPVNEWPEFDERTASGICFTSGTTGLPKGVVYTHRSTVLHALGISAAGGIGINPGDGYLLATNMSHVNGWGVPYACIMQGARIILPGPHPSPRQLLELITEEGPSVFVGSPTVAAMAKDIVNAEPDAFSLDSLGTLWLGGQTPPADLANWYGERGIVTTNGWGMTETSPMASYLEGHQTQGLPLPLVEMRIVGPEGEEMPWDGVSTGQLQVRSPWVAAGYLDDDGRSAESFVDGWFSTGDVAVMHPDGQLQLRDRFKDLIKSGGEWISSVEIENALRLHPSVREAAVIGIPDPTWLERPIAWVVTDGEASDAELRAYLERSFPKFWLPDAFVRVDEIPKTSVGKLDKAGMRLAQAARDGR
ncbi:long-chain-fatty-acid--CoA ligase [Kribbia dieselivorans]|uniref:long-chain-fatty-acid--CoA ligase n=1 Tax=Kribbia dieselivorans TaxID=331526 RepID=UPI0012EE837D|nr:long-chain-fatty-acid--CoA ligase [Kribbia dieselivorans]